MLAKHNYAETLKQQDDCVVYKNEEDVLHTQSERGIQLQEQYLICMSVCVCVYSVYVC